MSEKDVTIEVARTIMKFADHMTNLQWPILLQTKINPRLPPMEISITVINKNTMTILEDIKFVTNDMERLEIELQKLFQNLWPTLGTNQQKMDFQAHQLNFH